MTANESGREMDSTEIFMYTTNSDTDTSTPKHSFHAFECQYMMLNMMMIVDGAGVRMYVSERENPIQKIE